MSFLDEDDAGPSASGRSRPQRVGPTTQQQLLARRAVAVGAGILLLILLVFGIKGCLNARKERAFKDYVRDVAALTQEAGQVSKELFRILDNPRDLTPLNFEDEIKQNRSALDGLASRSRKLDRPDEMKGAQEALVLSFELRRDALTSIADEVGTALGREGRREAIVRIARQMLILLASDVIYAERASPAMAKALGAEKIAGVTVPSSQFLPDIDWLQTSRVTEALAKVRGGKRAVTPGVHGLGLIKVTAQPGDSVLDPNTPAALRASSRPSLQVEVQNQGESEESDVNVTVRIEGGAETIDLERGIASIAASESKTVSIPISPAPTSGRELTLTVTVEPVGGEKVTDNNEATYKVTYG